MGRVEKPEKIPYGGMAGMFIYKADEIEAYHKQEIRDIVGEITKTYHSGDVGCELTRPDGYVKRDSIRICPECFDKMVRPHEVRENCLCKGKGFIIEGEK